MPRRSTSTRSFRPTLTSLEARNLLTALAPTGLWLGQDGHDLGGGPSPLAGNGVQDMHVRLSGLSAAHPVSTVDVRGYGGGQWVDNIGPYNPYNAALVQAPGATTADLYLDPYQVETGRPFDMVLTYDDATSVTLRVNGGAADPNLRMPSQGVAAGWVGQDGHDLTSAGAAVGPDGYQDVHLSLSRLYAGTAVSAVKVTASPSGLAWAWGLNPDLANNAELLANPTDATRADLYFSPTRDLTGQSLSLTVTYADGKQDATTLAAGPAQPLLPVPGPAAVVVTWGAFDARWLGQDGLNLSGPGEVHLSLDRLPAGRAVNSATLTDPAGTVWVYLRPNSGATTADPETRPLAFRAGATAAQADLTFAPTRDETGATMTLRLVLDDGSILATRLTGGAADPGLRVADAASSVVVAHPGDDLNDLANRFGTVQLAAGLYPLSRPLVLGHPVTIAGAPGSTLVFSQGAADSPWTAAIKVNVSHVTLDGFAVRFAGPVRWRDGISYGPAVVGTTDNFDPWVGDPRLDLTFTHLDLQSPPASSPWEEAPHLFRLNNAESGTVADNRLKGGTTEFLGGPWTITGNTYLGTPVNTFSYGVFSGHYSHDVTIADNVAANSGPSGKTWRFVVLTQSGIGDVVRGNTVTGLGPADADTMENPNAPEVILTEAYTLHYEGRTAGFSADGLVVQIPTVLAGQVRAGDVLAILDGSQAGQWRSIAQVLSPTAFLLARAVTPGSFDVSVATGFVNTVIDGNTVDSRGSSTADDLVLAGNQFGAVVTNNHLLGGDRGFRLSAYPSESPNLWGWTHAPFLGALIRDNTVEDTREGGMLDVERSAYTKSSAGRVYLTASFLDNTGVWSASYLASRAASGATTPLRLVTVGNPLTADAGELRIAASGNTVQGGAALTGATTFYVAAGTVNGVAQLATGVALPKTSPQTATLPEPVPPPSLVAATPTPAPSSSVLSVVPLAPVAVVPPAVAPAPASGPASNTAPTAPAAIHAAGSGAAPIRLTHRATRRGAAHVGHAGVTRIGLGWVRPVYRRPSAGAARRA